MALTPLESLVKAGTKLWLDSIDPDEVAANRALGATGATSNPIIVSDLLKTGRFDGLIRRFAAPGVDDDALAWKVTDQLVKDAMAVFEPVWAETKGNDGWVSFELDPLIDDAASTMPVAQRIARYHELGKFWSAGHKNRMIKIPATEAGLGAIEELCAAGVTLNVTLIFSERQYVAARDAMWRGAQRRASRDTFKSVYSIFVSRLDVYTASKVPSLSPAAQGQVGIVNAKRIWKQNKEFWAGKGLPLQQEMIFASTGTKNKEDAPWKYVEAFAGSDIETNPPGTNKAVAQSGRTFTSHVNEMPPADVLAEIDQKVDMALLEKTLMEEGLKKFAEPQRALLALITSKRAELS